MLAKLAFLITGNPKTTTIGLATLLAGAIVHWIIPQLGAIGIHIDGQALDWLNRLVIYLAIAALGIVSKDGNTIGGVR